MSTIHYINECRILKVDELVYNNEPKQFRRKPKSDATKLLERQSKGYATRSNTCDVCFTARSRTDQCNCT